MGVKVAAGCMHWPQTSISHSSSSSTLGSPISSPSSKRRSLSSSVFGKTLNRSRSCGALILSKGQNRIKRIVSATFDSEYTDEEFSKEIRKLALRFRLSDDEDTDDSVSEREQKKLDKPDEFWLGDMIPASIERKANSMDLPLSLRIIQKKKQLEEGVREAGEFAYCSMKKAFSSMVFIIRELQSYTLQMREVLFLEDLQGILMKVQKEMNASFVWLFQQVFSHTPNLMVCVMILLANYSVYSMSNHVAVAVAVPPPPAAMESVSSAVDQTNTFDFVNSGGNSGGGGKFRRVISGTDGDGKFESEVEELGLWEAVVEEAERMRGDGGIDGETRRRFVSPVTVKMEEEMDTGEYLKTEVVYKTGLLKEPDNPLLLANYAQFLYLFSRDHKRAEEYFQKASEIEPKDAEALSKYGCFLWHAKSDLWAAEETLLEAISVEPNNPFYAATYAHFLWSNGGNDTCFPLESKENVNSDEA